MHGKVIVITGFARGLGLATTRKLKAEGAIVIGIDCLNGPVDLQLDGSYCFDLTDGDALEKAVESIQSLFGDVDILINNAGLLTLEHGESGVTANARRALEVNLFAAWELTSALLPGLLRRNGKLINVSSLFAMVNAPYVAAYAASKRGLSAWSDVMRMQYGDALDVVTVYPGFIDTAIHQPAELAGLSVKRLVSFKWGDKVVLSLEEPLESASKGLVRACHKRGLRNRGLTLMGTLTFFCARAMPSLIDAFISLRLRQLTRSGQLSLKPELID